MKNLDHQQVIALAEEIGIEYIEDLLSFEKIKEQKTLIPQLLAKQKQLLPIDWDDANATVAFVTPFFHELLAELRLIIKKNIQPVLTSQEAVNQAIEQCYRQKQVQHFLKVTQHKKEEDAEEFYEISDEHHAYEVIGFLDQMLIQSIRKGASDIHFDPNEIGLLIRFRIDGVLISIEQVSKEFSKQLTARIKVLSKLDIAEMRLPQDGRIKARYAFKELDFRVSTIPTIYGERVVLRILNNSLLNLGLQDCGMEKDVQDSFRQMMQLTQGLILVTGPTGSGKTSTLYSAMKELDSTKLNIMTVEDPVEFKLKGLSQIGVNPKIDFTFAKGLRHILRQDPDVIMIGEIRDQETAQIAIQAALTGHLVISTLHTNDAASALTRLVDMGIEPFLINSCLSGVLAQRLVRKICPDCLAEEINNNNQKKLLGLETQEKTFMGKGCESCFGLGYRGRLGIFEWLPLTPGIKEQFSKDFDSQKIASIAIKEGMRTLKEAGKKKVQEKVTSIAEVLKVVV
jgi:general secretion pathway protein E